MADYSSISSGASRVCALISDRRFNVADDGSLCDLVDGKHVSDRDCGFPAAEDVLARVGSLSGQEVFSSVLVSVGVPEVDLDERGSSSWVMNNCSNDALDVSLPFSVIEVAISGGSNSLGLGSGVDASDLALSLA